MSKIGFDFDGVAIDSVQVMVDIAKKMGYEIPVKIASSSDRLKKFFVGLDRQDDYNKIRKLIYTIGTSEAKSVPGIRESLILLDKLNISRDLVSARGAQEAAYGRTFLQKTKIENYFSNIIFCYDENEKYSEDLKIQEIKNRKFRIFLDDKMSFINKIKDDIPLILHVGGDVINTDVYPANVIPIVDVKDFQLALWLLFLEKQRENLFDKHISLIENQYKLIRLFANNEDNLFIQNIYNETIANRDCSVNNNKIYLSSPLTELTRFIYSEYLVDQKNIKNNCIKFRLAFINALENLQGLCEDNNYKLFLPHQHGDPVNHPHVTANEINIGDFSQVVCSGAIFVIHPFGSTGVGMESQMAVTYSIPLFVCGSTTIIGDQYSDTYITRIIKPDFIWQGEKFKIIFSEGSAIFDFEEVKNTFRRYFRAHNIAKRIKAIL